ncbi:MAG: hypothetical protein ACOYEQ_08130 [Bacillota bacterium]
MERPPRMVEYICLTCGAQGLVQVESLETEDQDTRGGFLLKCPKCDAGAFCLEREAVSYVLAHVHAETP